MRPGQQPRHQSSSNGQAKGRAQKPRADFVWKPKFANTLPDLPYDGKFLQCPFVPIGRFIDYEETRLETSYKKQTLCDTDVGVRINLVDPEAYTLTDGATLHPDDQYLLEDESANSLLKLKRSAQHSRVVPFMRRTEYISSEFNRFGAGADRQETRVGYNLFKDVNPSEMLYRDRASQIEAINKTFEDVKTPATTHYSKPGVTAVEEFEVFPDFDLWKYPFAQVIFDADPSYSGVPENLQKFAMENSMLSGLEGSDVGYFCPTVETIQKMMEDADLNDDDNERDPEDVYDFQLNREYTWVVRNKNSQNFEDDYMLYRKGDKFVFNELETRVKLNRKRRPAGVPKIKASMQVTYREPTEHEALYMDSRMDALMNEEDEDDEDEEMAESEAEKEKSDDDQGKQSSDDENNKKGSGDDKKSSSSDSKTSSSDSDSD